MDWVAVLYGKHFLQLSKMFWEGSEHFLRDSSQTLKYKILDALLNLWNSSS